MYLLGLLMFCLSMSNDCYEILSVPETEELLEKSSMKFDDFEEQLQTNYALIYDLGEKGVLVWPQKPGAEETILFKSRACFEEAVEADQFPLENFDKTIFEYDIPGILKISSSVPKYLSHIEKRFNKSIDKIDAESTIFAIKQLANDKGKLTLFDRLALYIVAAEYLRVQFNCRWILEKRYGSLNPFYIPLIINDQDMIMDVLSGINGMEDTRRYNFEKFRNDLYWRSKENYAKWKTVLIEPEN